MLYMFFRSKAEESPTTPEEKNENIVKNSDTLERNNAEHDNKHRYVQSKTFLPRKVCCLHYVKMKYSKFRWQYCWFWKLRLF